ncbi:hypothetical protein HYDPIDRAFT_107438 [Hydnomerulius pinastri MD-312]|nr:hypothetical protein HYDPIDRAFT_107438 [Hydnomerulius pinastri MD-312]
MPVRRQNTGGGNSGFGFFAMVGTVMALLKLKERWDDYRELSTEEGRVALPSSPNASVIYDEEDEIGMNTTATTTSGLLSTEIPAATRPKRSRAKNCCICCGMNCGLFWKAVGIVLALTVCWNLIKFAKWAMTPSPTGLEEMPEYSKSLGCLSASHYYNGPKTNFSVPLGQTLDDNTLNIFGSGAVGTIFLTEGQLDAEDVVYEFSLRRDDKDSFDDVSVLAEDGEFTLETPLALAQSTCMRFDITAYLPRNLKKLSINSQLATQVKFAEEGLVVLDDLAVTLSNFANDLDMILPSHAIQAKTVSLETRRGWLVGDVTITDKTSISTERGDAVANLHVSPVASLSGAATLETTSGSGRMDVFYKTPKSFDKRPISSTHASQRGGDLYLTYKEAEYSGNVEVKAKSYTTTGLQGMMPQTPGQGNTGLPWVGSPDGGDSLKVSSPSGWVGIYF